MRRALILLVGLALAFFCGICFAAPDLEHNGGQLANAQLDDSVPQFVPPLTPPRRVGGRDFDPGKSSGEAVISSYKDIYAETADRLVYVYRLGRKKYNAGFYAEAKEIFKSAIGVSEGDYLFPFWVAKSLYELHQEEEASTYCKKALEIYKKEKGGIYYPANELKEKISSGRSQ